MKSSSREEIKKKKSQVKLLWLLKEEEGEEGGDPAMQGCSVQYRKTSAVVLCSEKEGVVVVVVWGMGLMVFIPGHVHRWPGSWSAFTTSRT